MTAAVSSSVVSRVFSLGAFTAAGQLVIIGSLPLYSRAFDPATYGHYILFVGAFTVLSVFAGLRFDSAIVLPRKDGVARALTSIVLLLGMSLAAVITVTTTVTLQWFPATGLAVILGSGFGYGLAVATFVGAFQRALAGWCIRAGQFVSLGSAQFLFCVVSTVMQLGLVIVMPKLAALIWGYVIAVAVQALVLSRAFRWATGAQHAAVPWTRVLPAVARRYRRFPTYMVGYALASSIRDRLIQIVMALGAGSAVVGRFGMAYRVIYAPNSLIYSAVSPVFFSLASRRDRASVGRFAAGLVEIGFVLMLVPYAALSIEAPGLTDLILGANWAGTGIYLQALAAPALLLAATCWLDRAFDSFRRQNVALALELTFTLVSVSAVAIASRLLTGPEVTWLFGCIALVYYWIYFFVTFKSCGFPRDAFNRACRTGLTVSIVALGGMLLIHFLQPMMARLIAYFVLMALIVLGWFVMLGGRSVVKNLTRTQLSQTAERGPY